MTESNEDYRVCIGKDPDTDVTIMTVSAKHGQDIENAISRYDPKNMAYNTYLTELCGTSLVATPKMLNELAVDAQSDLDKILRINSIVRVQVNKNDIIGKVEEIINSNVNTGYTTSYTVSVGDDEKELAKLNESKQIISDFNAEIDLGRLIRDAVSTAHMEGNFICYCRNVDGRYTVTWFPLGIAEISDYDINGEPVVLINMEKLCTKLGGRSPKRRKNRESLFFQKIGEEIKANYPPEIYKAFIDNDPYARLDYRWTGVVRINNQKRKYGLSPIFRALYPALMIDQFDNTNMVNAKVKAKKFIVQTMRKELVSGEHNRDKYTAGPTVEDIKYVSCRDTGTIDINTVNNYRERILSSLGVGFLMSTSSTGASTASISLSELLKTINSITEQIERFVQKWYQNIIAENGLEPQFAPTIKILDSELLSPEERQELAKVLFTTFGASRETCFGMVGLNIEDETNKRRSEKLQGLDDVFTPYQSTYTYTNNDGAGRPSSDNTDTKAKQNYDKEYNKNART